jgi:DNA-binding CsgD family transcriptional regulator
MARGSSFAPDLATVVGELGGAAFARALHAYLRHHVSASLVFAYVIRPDGGGATHLLTETASLRMRARARRAARTYVDEDFRRDHATLSGIAAGITIRLQQAHDLADARFRQRYFDNLGLGEEMAMTQSDGPDILYIGVGADHFSDDAQDFMRSQAPLVLALMRKHHAMVEAAADQAARPSAIAQMHAMLVGHPGGLTEREAQICVLVTRGYTSEAIGLNLGISSHTVATHRKKAYAKLRVSSAAELFAQMYVPESAPLGMVG